MQQQEGVLAHCVACCAGVHQHAHTVASCGGCAPQWHKAGCCLPLGELFPLRPGGVCFLWCYIMLLRVCECDKARGINEGELLLAAWVCARCCYADCSNLHAFSVNCTGHLMIMLETHYFAQCRLIVHAHPLKSLRTAVGCLFVSGAAQFSLRINLVLF